MEKLILVFLLFFSLCGFATHNRAGEIVYQRIEPKTQVVAGSTVQVYNYLITVIKYTDDGTPSGTNNSIADRCMDTVYFGDGQKRAIERVNGVSPLCAGCIPCGCPHCGEIIINDPDGYRVKLNTYTVTHVYPGAGSYTISTSDPYRNDGVLNMTQSGQQAFYLQSILLISNFSGSNTSPQFTNPPIDEACVGKCFYHNPGAYDVDGDSLSFELSTPRGANGQTVLGYKQPGTSPGGLFSIDPVIGKLSWCSPTVTAEYNIAFIVKEWRKNTDGTRILIGSVLRDMQVIVLVCPNNPPAVLVPADTCVEAGSLILKTLSVTDLVVPPNDPNENRVTLSGSGGAFSAPAPHAFLSTIFAVAPYNSLFTWQTSCEQVREQPYQTTFKVEDQGPVSPLANFNTYSIKVIPPSVKNVSAVAINSNIRLSWDPSGCNPISNPLIGYKIYRKNNCDAYTSKPCKIGIDPASGFVFIGQSTSTQNMFLDNNGNKGLTVGQDYGYQVVAFYADGSQSFAGSQVCTRLKQNVPIVLNVDVLSTSPTGGSVFVRWLPPLLNSGDLDTLATPGPYQYRLYYRNGSSGNFVPIYSSTSPYFLGLNSFYTHNNINTADSIASYQVEFSTSAGLVGISNPASSIFVSSIPSDRKIALRWKGNTPWTNYKYTVYRKDPGASTYSIQGTTELTEYVDSIHVVNHYAYCYKVLTQGQYSDPLVLRPLINTSQEVCATAKDLTPPCPPSISLDASCKSGFLNVNWINEKTACTDDVIKRVLFYKPTLEANYMLVDTFDNNVATYSYDGVLLISGCYALQAVDSSGNASLFSADACMDICPEFELPNIFSPNNDKVNDVYKAVKVKQIKQIDLSVFDRWGALVYKTTDPYFQWDAVSMQSKQLVSDDTFFYVCEVYEPYISGVRKRELKGYLQVVR